MEAQTSIGLMIYAVDPYSPPLLKDLHVLSLCSTFRVGTRAYIIILLFPASRG